MSRRAFRADVAVPRPSSAWVLVVVASAPVWITQQLDPWVIVVQAAVIIGALWRRTEPFEWQSSPVALNVGMFAIVSVTIAVALRGGPSTIALAHFAALTQALQLLDARPRRTEFLLVALALFQVVLAANLTDSVFFTPLLLAFLFAVVWTLLVHTLRSEALEAGEDDSLPRALTPGLLRTTLLASGLSVLLALVLFVVLPRLRSSVVQGSSAGIAQATAGFSNRVTLGELGRIRQDPTVVMRVETLQGERPVYTEAYWRGLAFDHFDGRSWSITPATRRLVPGSPEGGVWIGPGRDVNLVQRILRDPVEAGVLFGIGDARGIQGTLHRIVSDRNGGLYAVGQANDRVRYTVGTLLEHRSDETLRRDDAVPPQRGGKRYLQLPESAEPIARLAHEIVVGLETDAERIRALERYLLDHGRYSDTPPSVDPEGDVSPLEAFLFGAMAAHCEYFASALVVLARSVGIPARMVNGFAGGRRNRIGDFVEVARSDAHAWVEVHYREARWVRYDATPTALRSRPAVAMSLSARARELASAIELWWFQRVVGFDRSDQIHALRRAWFAWKRERGPEPAPTLPSSASTPWRFEDAWPGRRAVWIGGAGLALAILARRLRRRQASAVPAFYRQALTLLSRRGLVRPASTTARDFARRAHDALPERAAGAFERLTEAYLEQRFGRRDTGVGPPALRELREAMPHR